MKNIQYEGYLGPRLPRELQLKRIQNVMMGELTELQRQTLLAYFMEKKSIPQIARERGVNKSTVSRTIRRAEKKLRKYLKY